MTFNINNQTGGVVNNVAGNQWISGGQEGSVVTLDAARDAAHHLLSAITAATLPPDVAAPSRADAAEVDAELRNRAPDRRTVADRLRRLVDALARTGSLVAAIAGPVRTLAIWLGQLGAPIIQALPLL